MIVWVNVVLDRTVVVDGVQSFSGQLTISVTINNRLTVTIDGSKHTNDITSLHSQ